MVDGQGADEYLMGYPGLFPHLFLDLLSSFQLKNLFKELISSKKNSVHLLKALFSLLPESLRLYSRKILKKNSLTPSWLNLKKLNVEARYPLSQIEFRGGKEQTSLMFTKTSLPELLHLADRNSMAHSIESRTPFLDHRLVEYVYNLPTEEKIKGSFTKHLLREAMKGILPEDIRLRRDKIGFQAPEMLWIKEEKEAFYRKLEMAIERSSGILHPSLLKEFEKKPCSMNFWQFIIFGEWLETFQVTI